MPDGELDPVQAARVQELKEAEREMAYIAVSRAISGYRWWGLNNILSYVRMFITRVKIRLGMRLWP